MVPTRMKMNVQQCNRVQAISNLKSNQHAKDCISLLAIRNEADVRGHLSLQPMQAIQLKSLKMADQA